MGANVKMKQRFYAAFKDGQLIAIFQDDTKIKKIEKDGYTVLSMIN